MHVCLRWFSQNHRGSSATGKRGRSKGEQWGKEKKKNECNEAETECKDKQKRQSREGQGERENLKKCHPRPSMFVLPLCRSCVVLTHSVNYSSVRIRNKQEQ